PSGLSSGGSSGRGGGGSLGTTGGGSTVVPTNCAKASWTGPRASTSMPAFGGGGGAPGAGGSAATGVTAGSARASARPTSGRERRYGVITYPIVARFRPGV